MLQLSQASAATITVGPVMNADGSLYTGALTYADFVIQKAGASGAATIDAGATVTYAGGGGMFTVTLTATDTNTAGFAEVSLIGATGHTTLSMATKDLLVGPMISYAPTLVRASFSITGSGTVVGLGEERTLRRHSIRSAWPRLRPISLLRY